MEQDIRDALSDIKVSVREGFASTNRRIDDLVTQGEFRATIERVDIQHMTLRKEFDTHVENVPTRDRIAAERDVAIANAAEARDESIRTEFRSELEGFRTTTRWAVGIAATAVGLICTAASLAFNIITATP